MKDPYAYVEQMRLVYGFFDSDDQILYIGSSFLPLEKLEYNHRNALKLWPNEEHTRFRKALNEIYHNCGKFKRLVELKCSRPVIESFEGQLIRAFNTSYNDDRDPVTSSKYYGRY
jgi:hypothetical protein